MPGRFERDGVAFVYPENWQLRPDDYEAGWCVSVFSPDTAFLSVTLDTLGAPPGRMADVALAALREEFPDLESEPAGGTLAGLAAVGHDVEFMTLDLTNSCFVRSVSTGRGTLLVYWQASDLEPRNQEVLRAMCASLSLDDDD
jgi:hypothetical protein